MRTTIHQTTPTPHRPLRHAPCPAALLCACLAVGLLAAPAEAHVMQEKRQYNSSQAASEKKGSVRVKYFGSSSEESTRERDRRLYRECKGRPDAGACLGYTRR